MSDELQQHAWDTSRANINSGDGPAIREGIFNTGAKELFLNYGGTDYYIPTHQRFETGIASPTTPETIECGAQIVGVKNPDAPNAFTQITGNVDLWECLKSIDTAINSVAGVTGAILKDGSIDMESHWNAWESITVDNPNLVQAKDDNNYGMLDFNVLGDVLVADDESLGTERFADPSFLFPSWPTTDYEVTSPWTLDDTNNRVNFDGSSSNTGYFRQKAGSIDTIEPNSWYLFKYVIHSNTWTQQTLSSYPRLIGTTTIADQAITLEDLSVGAHYIMFKTTSDVSSDTLGCEFTSAPNAGGATGTVEISEISLKKIVGGDIEIVGDIKKTVGSYGTELTAAFYETGTFEATPTGFSPAHSSVTVRYTRIANLVVIILVDPISGTADTSNTFTLNFSNLPSRLEPIGADAQMKISFVTDNSSHVADAEANLDTTGTATLQLFKDGSLTGWAAANSKGIVEDTVLAIYNI